MKRTKTFSGCWTCRARKVKCDETKPYCKQCQRRELDCGGYGVRLQWLTPDTGHISADSRVTVEPSNLGLQRRQLPQYPEVSALDYKEVEDVLRIIDAFEDVPDASVPNSEKAHLELHNFGVFRLPPDVATTCVQTLQDTPPQNNVTNQDDSSANHVNSRGVEATTDSLMRAPPQSALVSLIDTFSPIPYTAREAAADLCQLRRTSLAGPSFSSMSAIPTLPGTSTEECFSSNHNSLQARAFLAPARDISDFTVDISSHSSRGLLSEDENYLMGHYTQNVVNMFCIIDTDKSPWKTVHIPRVLQSIGESMVYGSSSRILGALKNCLLSTSSFSLSNMNGSTQRKADADRWAQVATKCRCEAMRLLHQAMEVDLKADIRPKYKDFLATMLSTVTIDVIAGDMSSIGIHLRGAGELIRHMLTIKSKFSKKAQSLHRIYLYLHTMHRSTSSSGLMISKPDDDHMLTLFKEAEPHFDLASFEHIYTTAHSLIFLMTRSVNLVGKVLRARQESLSMPIPEDLRLQCESLEQEILDWSLEEQLAPFQPQFDEDSFEILLHQSRAFHNALVIYHSQHVRLMSYRFLRPNVEKVLDSIEYLEKKKASIDSKAAPLFWPAFIAASEAFDHDFQERFRRWYDDAELYGVRAATTGSNVLHEVWMVGPDSADRTTSLWRSVVERSGTGLMLT